MSNKTMTLTEISKSSKEFKDTHTLQVGGFRSGGRTTTRDLILSIREEMLSAINNLGTKLNARIDNLEIRINNVEKSINARIDNFVTKNNLKE